MVGLVGFGFGDSLFSLCWYGSSSFSGSTWYIPFLSIYNASFWPMEVGYGSTRIFDSGCTEYFGGQGVY